MSLLLAFAFVVVPAVQRLTLVREVCDVIHKYDVEATALFYTESEVSCEAEASIRSSLRYRTQPAASPRSNAPHGSSADNSSMEGSNFPAEGQ
jgi:hypothetical protein